MAKKKKKTSKKATPKAGPTVKQLQSAAKDMNTLMNDINNGNYASPIEMKDDVAYLTENIIGMVEKEMFKQDKDSLNVETIAVIEELGVKFESLADDPAQGGEEDGDGDVQKEKEEVKAEKKAPVKKTKKTKTPGVIQSIVDIIKEKGPITKQDVLVLLAERFPDRPVKGMGSTFNIQIGGRLTREKGIKIIKGDNGYSIEE
jgi:hypothetical protein